MGDMLRLALGLVAVGFVIIVIGEAFYLFYWRKRRHYPRNTNVSVAPVTEGEAISAREPAEDSSDVVINVTCTEYQIAALHQGLVEKLFPAVGVTSREAAQDLMGPTRMLFTITEETKEELDKLDLDNKRSKRPSRSKSMSDFSVSPVGPLSPLTSSPFITPPSSPDHFVTPYSTPTFSPLVSLVRSHCASPVVLKSPNRITNDHTLTPSSAPVGPPSPTRPSFPFLSRDSSPGTSPDNPASILPEAAEWCSLQSRKLSPANPLSAFYSPPRKAFLFATPAIHGKQVEGQVKASSPLRSCTYVYENHTFSPSASPQRSAPSPHLVSTTLGDHFAQENKQWRGNNLSSSTPPQSSPTAPGAGPGSPFFNHRVTTSPSEAGFATSPSCKPSSQRSSAMLFPSSSSFARPCLAPVFTHPSPTASFPGTGPSSPTDSTASLSHTSWESMCMPFIVEPSSSSAH